MKGMNFIGLGLQAGLLLLPRQVAEAAAPGVRTGRCHGVLCLTFDDRNFDGWRRALPVFRKFDAHATFFICGAVDDDAVSMMTALRAEGHSLGLHGLTHAAATKLMDRIGEKGYLAQEIYPQIDAARRMWLDVCNWAYPMSARNGRTDAVLGSCFRRLRTGCVWRKEVKNHPLSSYDNVFLPLQTAGVRKVIPSSAFPSAFPEWESDVTGALERVRERNEFLCLYAHDIRFDAKMTDNDISVSQLEFVLSCAAKLGIPAKGFDEL